MSDSMTGAWTGVLIVEDTESGDGRMFSGGSLTVAPLPLPLMWQRQTSSGHDGSVQVGRIDEVWRDGKNIHGRGVFDLASDDGAEAYRQVKNKFLRGISGDVDSVRDVDVELVYADTPGMDDDPLAALFSAPALTIFHGGRLRGATLVQFPAFVEASVLLEDESECVTASAEPPALVAGAVSKHDTATTDGPWDAGINEKRLDSPMTVDTAENVYAWYDNTAVVDGRVTKSACKFPHHEVSADGTPGPANLTACSAGIAALHGARGNMPDIPAADRRSVYEHLAQHLRDADREPPPFEMAASATLQDALTACGCTDIAPPREWFEHPGGEPTGSINITDDGRIYGYGAVWGTCHTGFANQCVTPPREGSHDYFMLGETLCADGTRVATGTLTMGTGHAATQGLSPTAAAAHYDNTGTVVADVVTGEDKYGIWYSGALRPGLSPMRLQALRGAKLSGDWRRIGGQLRLVAFLAVNVPGFPVPRTRSHTNAGRQLSLVAAGVVDDNVHVITGDTDDADTVARRVRLRSLTASLRDRVHDANADRMLVLRARIHGR